MRNFRRMSTSAPPACRGSEAFCSKIRIVWWVSVIKAQGFDEISTEREVNDTSSPSIQSSNSARISNFFAIACPVRNSSSIWFATKPVTRERAFGGSQPLDSHRGSNPERIQKLRKVLRGSILGRSDGKWRNALPLEDQTTSNVRNPQK